MIRTQIQLTEEQSRRLKAIAARQGISIARLIRQSIDALLSRTAEPTPEDRFRRAMQAAGRFRSGRRDVAQRHDEYLGEDYAR